MKRPVTCARHLCSPLPSELSDGNISHRVPKTLLVPIHMRTRRQDLDTAMGVAPGHTSPEPLPSPTEGDTQGTPQPAEPRATPAEEHSPNHLPTEELTQRENHLPPEAINITANELELIRQFRSRPEDFRAHTEVDMRGQRQGRRGMPLPYQETEPQLLRAPRAREEPPLLDDEVLEDRIEPRGHGEEPSQVRSPLDLTRFQRYWSLPHLNDNPFPRSAAFQRPAVHYPPSMAGDTISAAADLRLKVIPNDRARYLLHHELRTLVPVLSGLVDAIGEAELCRQYERAVPRELVQQLETIREMLGHRLDMLEKAGQSQAELQSITGAIFGVERVVAKRGSQLGAFLSSQVQIRTVSAAFAQVGRDQKPQGRDESDAGAAKRKTEAARRRNDAERRPDQAKPAPKK